MRSGARAVESVACGRQGWSRVTVPGRIVRPSCGGSAGQEMKGNLWEQPSCLVGVLWGMAARPDPAGSQCMSGMEPVSSVTVTLPAGFLVTPLAMP